MVAVPGVRPGLWSVKLLAATAASAETPNTAATLDGTVLSEAALPAAEV